MKPFKKLHFIGIGGAGMSALAQLLSSQGIPISGSDRAWCNTQNNKNFKKLQKQKITLYPQNGEGITKEVSHVVVSTAIEPDNLDLIKAKQLHIKQVHRSDLLAQLASEKRLIAVSGTSGKSTIAGMISVLLDRLNLSPTIINGAEILNYINPEQLGNSRKGSGEYCVIEADESDGTLIKHFPEIALLSNLSKDHKPLDELKKLFQQFIDQTQKKVILNADCPFLQTLASKEKITYGIKNSAQIQAQNIQLSLEGSQFTVNRIPFFLHVPGEHNLSNGLAAIATGMALGFSLKQIAPALETFQGIERRLERVSKKGYVYDDFAHNPDKIGASLKTLAPFSKRLIAIFQPHGYQPTQFLLNEYAEVFTQTLRPQDQLYLLPIYDAGGSTNRNISSCDLADKITGKQTLAVSTRSSLLKEIKKVFQPNDTVLVMGARDPSLTDLSHEIANLL